ncbi:MAG: putative baseplate assembly protein [Pseudomonadota bacterium]
MIFTCCDQNRRAAVDAHPTLNGIDWLEVLDSDAPIEKLRQQTLLVRLLKPVPPGLTPDNIRIEGGERIREITIKWVAVASEPTMVSPPVEPPEVAVPDEEATFFSALDEPDHVLLVRTDTAGDYASYRLQLVQGSGSDTPLPDFDPRLSAVDFSFKVECPSDFDCLPRNTCPEEPKPDADINYLARDYASLRRLVTDRLSRQMPGWRDRSPADLATTLAELIAYVGDHQHYQLDGITTEAYLHTARRRSSLRRHALLVDYPMHDGCNARAWLHLEVNSGPFELPADLRLHTRVAGVPPRMTPDSPEERLALQAGPLVFEPLLADPDTPPELRAEHNEFNFYTWGDTRCCLPVGATRATLRGHWPDLAVSDVLVFEERVGPLTNQAKDADPTHRHAVRLTEVRAFDGTEPLTDPLPPDPAHPATLTEITEIRWHDEDALPFPVCLSSETDEAHGSAPIENVSRALGNIVLVDHGLRISDESLGSVPATTLDYPPGESDPCDREEPEPLPPRFRPILAEGPVTHQGSVTRTRTENGVTTRQRVLFDPDDSASAAFVWRTADAFPDVRLTRTQGVDEHWFPRRDLLASHATSPHFVLETEDDGTARVRFGDDRHGRRPDADTDTDFTASYRIGNGPEGNVGSDTIVHAVTDNGQIGAVRNPLPARGGVAAESAAEVRRSAPRAFRTQERAVTPEDYAEVTERLAGVQRAAAGPRWTGSWHTLFVTVDRDDGDPVDEDFAGQVVAHLDRYRMAGHDLHVNDPVHVPLEMDLLVCVADGYFRSDVRQGLLEVLSNRTRADGTPGLFHPDNFTFGQSVFLSPVYAAARTVPGVASVQVTRFHRQGQEDPKPLTDGFMTLGGLEIARLDNDRNFPEHGVLRLDLHGGK